jgi:hypothetical protein
MAQGDYVHISPGDFQVLCQKESMFGVNYWHIEQVQRLLPDFAIDFVHQTICPVCLRRLCMNCWQPKNEHVKGKCLFQETRFRRWTP